MTILVAISAMSLIFQMGTFFLVLTFCVKWERSRR